VDIITSSSREISTSSQSLSQGTNEQASSTEEISSAIGELAAQTKQASDNAINTQKISSEAMAAANSGEAKMNQMVEAMEEISVSSRNIAKIMKTIDEIAFQTNLLALNAAVEAARAGRHGKGFAVVAEEVNNLSKRSSRAAKETADIIEGSIKKIEVGKNITEAAQDTFQKIFSKISEVASLSAEIAKASEEQVKGIDQVERGIRQIDQVTQQNASIAEENASASETLTSQAIQLKDMVDKFVLDKGNGHGRAKISQNQGLLGGHSLREGDASKPVFHAQELKKPINPVRTVSP
jgi:methyl-accepting chemotaxis protein